MSNKIFLKWILVFGLIGFFISLYSLLHNQGFAPGSFCTLNETFDCDVVNKGPYARMFGLPISLIGLIGYGFIFVGAFLKYRNPKDRSLTVFLFLITSAGLLFSFYLTGLEAFVLHAWCVLCLTSQFLMIILTAISGYLFFQERNV